jgi:6-phosphogluconolactonase
MNPTYSVFSRRAIIQAAAAASVVATVGAACAGHRSGAPVTAYVGTYGPKGKGIYRFSVDAATGRLTPEGLAAETPNASWFELDASQRFLYAVNEVADFNGGTTGSVSAFAVHPANGALSLVNRVSSAGAGPAHLSIHPAGAHVLVANYLGGNVAVLPIRADGGLSSASDVKNDADACGATPCAPGVDGAEKAPPGSFASSDHDGPHAHMIASDAAGRFVIVNDLGLDRTLVWRFDAQHGRLSQPKTVASSAGAGPRHFVFHPNGRWFYSINEEASTLAFMRYDPATGTLSPQAEVQTLPPGFVGTNFASEVLMSPDGKVVYCLNRLHDSIAIFMIDVDGRPTWTGEEWTRGSYPRSCSLDPSGRFLYVCNQRSDHIAIFRVAGGGRLHFTGHFAAVGSPAMIRFSVG